MRSDRIFALVFAVLLLNEMAAGMYREIYEVWYLVSKPMLLLSIIVYFVWQTGRFSHPIKRWLILGFVFSWLGDIALMFQATEPFFLYGLAAFLLAHIAYILAFRIWVYDNLEIPLMKRAPWMAFLLMMIGVGYFKVLEPGLGSMKLPVIVYMVIILLMVLMALNRYKKVTRKGFAWVASGAFAFLVSDCILAYNKFIDPVDYAGVWIMLTYGFAQWAIMQGGLVEVRYLRRVKDPR